MGFVIKLLLLFLLYNEQIKSETLNFPSFLKVGVATASYQVEGGWNASGKGENIWDRFTHQNPSPIFDNSTGDISCDSYHKWQKDIEMVKDLRVDYYRFSLSWSRILPSGFNNKINLDGVLYYNNIINELIRNGIEPLVTLYHWDLPQPLQDIGGFPNPLLVDYFRDYAKVAFELFGDRVKRWITFNEPPGVCVEGFEDAGTSNVKAPGLNSRGIACYLCGKTLLMAHAATYHLYDKYFRAQQGGKIGITVNTPWYEPLTNRTEDLEATERAFQMNYGWWVHPILFSNGDYPPLMIDRIARLSKAENFTKSRLPPFTESERKFIEDTIDFLGLNHYSSARISSDEKPSKFSSSFEKDLGIKIQFGGISSGFRKLLNWIKKTYKNPLLYVTENGTADENSSLNDDNRITYLMNYICQLLRAIQDGVNVERYTIWSLMDNMEWAHGYTIKMGLYRVNFTNPNRNRTPKSSVEFVKNLMRNRQIECEKTKTGEQELNYVPSISFQG